GRVVVVAPIDDSPAMKAGILAGDVITRIDGKPIKDMTVEKIASMIRGLPKSAVTLQIGREGFTEPIEFRLERAPVKIASVEYGIMEGGAIGYLKIKNFGSETGRDAAKAMKLFKKKGVKKVIIDVRNNPGGLLSGAVEVSELLLDREKTIVSTRGKKGSGSAEVYKSKSEPLYRGALAVLVNNGTASAAEILAAAVRDNGRGSLIGEKTFGKGSVQKSFNLDDDIGVYITVARYYTPSGEMIHKKGIEPDRKVTVEKFSESDMKGLKAVREGNLMEHFSKGGIAYTIESRESFRAFLAGKGVTLSEKTGNFILKDWINRFKKKPLYDLEFDSQLNEAVKYIGGR
ncbi:MAG: PDZ domain-containing protein, partial [Chrysiogenales bacterium]